MHRYALSLSAVISLLVASTLSAADAAKPIEGTLLVGDHTYKLAHVVAYETKSGDEMMVTILASDRKIPIEKIKEALREHDGSDEQLSLSQPHIRLAFGKSGEPSSCRGWADNTSFVTPGRDLTGALKLDEGRARGEAHLKLKEPSELSDFEKKFNFKNSFDIRFDVALGADAAPKAAPKSSAGPVKPSVTGTFKGNGKPAKLAFVSARPGEEFAGQPSIDLIFTEKDHSKDKQAHVNAGFGRYGSALLISLHEDGNIFGCQVIHTAHSHQGFSSIGRMKSLVFDVGDGKIEGHLTTDGETDTFGDKWEVDIQFTVPFVAPAPKAVVEERPVAKKADVKTDVKTADLKPAKEKPAAKARSKPAAKRKSSSPADAFNVHDLAILKDASDVEYKTLVEQLVFKHASGVQALAGDFSKSLADQEWKDEGADLVTANSAIMVRKHGDATLTIFINPAGKGSKVTVMTTGLNWEAKAKPADEK